MRISELSAQTGISPASIKYYAREGLLPAGERTGYNQTDYSQWHAMRLHLIRALLDTAGMSVAATKQVLAAIDDQSAPIQHVLGTVQHAVSRGDHHPSEQSLAKVQALIDQRGWQVSPNNPGIAQCATILDRYDEIGRGDLGDTLDGYAEGALSIAVADINAVDADWNDRDRMAESVAVGTALGDLMVAGLRRIAQEHSTKTRLGANRTRPNRPR